MSNSEPLAKQRQQDPENEPQAEQTGSESAVQVLCDLCCLAGMGSLGYGLFQIHPPTMFIVLGVLVMIGALLASRG